MRPTTRPFLILQKCVCHLKGYYNESFPKMYWVTQKKYSCLIKPKMKNKKGIFKIKIGIELRIS